MDSQPAAIEMNEVTDPLELEQAREQREQFDRNSAWLQNHISEIYTKHRGKCICICGQEAFVAEKAEDAIVLARTAHPDDEGWFTRYIPREKVARIYAI